MKNPLILAHCLNKPAVFLGCNSAHFWQNKSENRLQNPQKPAVFLGSDELRQKLELQSFIESLDSRAQQLQRRSRSVQPRLGYDGAAAAATGFAGFGRVLLQNVEQLKGEAGEDGS